MWINIDITTPFHEILKYKNLKNSIKQVGD